MSNTSRKPIRRVITGHSPDKKAVVLMDAPAAQTSVREHASSTTIWSTLQVPASVDAQGMKADPALHFTGSGAPQGGIRFMVMDLEPGCSGKMHRTDTVDLVVCIEGQVEMQLSEESVHLRAGDILIQQSTIHAWKNPGTVPARLAITLIDAKPLGDGFPPSRKPGPRKET